LRHEHRGLGQYHARGLWKHVSTEQMQVRGAEPLGRS
jgi:hypothetical protein